MQRFWKLFLLLVCAATVSWGQVDRGSISGLVTDATGAVVPGVTVAVTETETGVHYKGDVSNEQGVYRILNLPIGTYSLVFSRDGFKSYTRGGVTVSMSQNVTLNAKLEIGNRVDSVTVTDDTTLLNTQDAVVGSTVTGEVLTDLPLTADGGRDVRNFGRALVPTFSTVTGTQLGYNNSVAGSQITSIATSVDGVSADAGLYGIVNGPGMDAVSQYQVQVSGISAAAAQTGGGEQMYEMKSGTNTLHGSAFGFLANEVLNANTWSNNYFLAQCVAGDSTCKANYKRPMDRYNDWGFSAGGPIWKNHTFIFGAYEHYHKQDMTYSPQGATVPTTKMLDGDFSELFSSYTTNPLTGAACSSPCPTGQTDASGNPIYFGSIFNPSSPGSVFLNNQIPSGSISAESQKIINIYKQYYQPENSNLTNNYWGFATFGTNPINTNYHLDLKLDHNFSERNHINASYNRYRETPINPGGLWQHGSNDGGPFTQSYLQGTQGWEVRVQDYYTINSNLVNFATVGYNYWLRWDVTSHTVDNSALNFPSTSSGANNFPVINFGGNSAIGESSLGSDKADHLPYYQAHYKDELSWVHGRHVAKFGGEFIAYGANSTEADGYLNYTFNSNTGESLAVSEGNISPYVGFGLASFELGQVGSASKAVGGHLRGRRKAMNFYAEDTIKVNPKLTINASLRWDFNTRWKETNGHWTDFVLSATNTSWAPLSGAFQFLSNGSQSFEKNQYFGLFAPHVGASYQVTPKLVARGSWALSYVPLGINQWGGAPFAGEASFGFVGQDIMPSASSPVNAIYQWDSGSTYPGNYTAATRDQNANTSCPWCAVSVDPDKLHLGHTNNWNVGVEYELDKSTVVDVNYIGNRGGHLHDGANDPRNYPKWSSYQPILQRNCGSSSYSSCAGQWVASESDANLAGVTWYPFLTTMTNGWGGYNAPNALLPYPQTFQGGVLFTDSAIGSSRYDALVTEVKRRTSSGLSADLSYTFSHEAGNVNRGNGNFAENWGGGDPYQDPYAMDQLKNLISPNDVRHEVKGYASYSLPFGNGRKWLAGHNQIVNQSVSGWTLGTEVDYHAGQPMGAVRPSFWNYPNWANTFANVVKTPGALKNHFKHLDLKNMADESNQFVDPASFTDMYASDGSGMYLGTLGNQPTYYSNWRGWAYYDEDLSILKKFFFHENRYRVTLRAEFFDVFNRHHLGGPNTSNIGQSYFGNVTSVSGNRYGQFGARFEW
ncbi:MAG: TonB-dependent receptor [Terracidiphilus sp.]|nr:TonB-dependent receptor [Terracidiphilus sp.]